VVLRCAVKFTRWQHPAVGHMEGLLCMAALVCNVILWLLHIVSGLA